jgi:hypothetical protein
MEEISGKTRSGKAKNARMTPEERKALSAKMIAAKKERSVLPKAEYFGTLQIGELEIQCAVLPDGRRVLSQRGVISALGRKRGGGDVTQENPGGGELPFYLSANALKPFINNNLAVVISKPILYSHSKGGGIAQGVLASILPQVCDVWLKAREAGVLMKQQLAVAQRAEILMRGLAHVGIIALVDEATGYQKDRARDALAKILEAYVAKELQPWVKTFPTEYYEHLFRLYGIPFPPESKPQWRPPFFGKITNNVIYARLAPELLPELKKSARKAEKRGKLHQWLTNDIEHPKLREHLASIVTLLKLSGSPEEFKSLVDRVHPPFNETMLLDF